MLQLLLIGYAGVVLLAAIFQRRLIYFPTQFPPDRAGQAAAERGFVPWKDKAGRVIGWKIPASETSTGSVLIVHGNAGCALHRDYIAKPIHAAAALEVYVLEYPGYGARADSPTQRTLLTAADQAFESLDKTKPVYVVSESIGVGVAAHLAKTHPANISGMLLFAPFDNLAAVAQSKMPFLPVYLLLLDRYRPAEWLKDFRGPVKIVLAEADEIVPPASGRRLFDGYNGPKALQVVPGAGHNDVAGQSVEWWKEVFRFWLQNSRPAR